MPRHSAGYPETGGESVQSLDARDIADGGPNDRYPSRFRRRGSGVPTMYAPRKEFPRSTGVERANARATARRRRSLRPILTPSEGADDLGPKSLLVWGTDLPPRRRSTAQTRGHPTNSRTTRACAGLTHRPAAPESGERVSMARNWKDGSNGDMRGSRRYIYRPGRPHIVYFPPSLPVIVLEDVALP